MKHAILMAGMLALAAAAAPAWAAEYDVKRIRNLGGPLVGRAINADGRVAGYLVTASGDQHAFVTGPNGAGIKDLGQRFPQWSWATGVNDLGEVVGYADDDLGQHAFRTGPDAKGMKGLKLLSKRRGRQMKATGINNLGQVVGGATNADPMTVAFVTEPGGLVPRDLGTLGGIFSFGNAINDDGCVVGASETSDQAIAPFILCPGFAMTDLGNLGGRTTYATAINALGQVAGFGYDANGQRRAFITDAGGLGLRDLGTPAGFTQAQANGINAEGRVVGFAYTTSSALDHAFVSGPNGSDPRDLNTLVKLKPGTTLTSAVAINGKGQIVALDILQNTYLLTPLAPMAESKQ